MSQPMTFAGPDLRKTTGRGYVHPTSGKTVPGVTTVSGLMDKPHLIKWSAKLAATWAANNVDTLIGLDVDARIGAITAATETLRSESRDTGSLAHWVIEQLTAGEAVDVPDRVAHQVRGWTAWREAFVDTFLENEATVWSHTYGYAGTLDTIARLKDGRVALVDYKTGKDIYPEVGMQMWALRHADCIVSTDGERPLPTVDLAAVVHLPAPVLTPTGKASIKGSWSFREIRTGPTEASAFLALLMAYEWEKVHASGVIGGKQTTLPKQTAPDLAERVANATTEDELVALWRDHEREWSDVLTVLAANRKKELAS